MRRTLCCQARKDCPEVERTEDGSVVLEDLVDAEHGRKVRSRIVLTAEQATGLEAFLRESRS